MIGLKAVGIAAGYGKRKVINNASFEVERGSVTALLGANGSGKTTLIKAVCSILPHSGECILDGIRLEDLSPRELSRLCSYIPQKSGISIDISALDVVLMGLNPYLGIFECPSRVSVEKAEEMLESVGLCDLKDANYMHLSEGQKALCIMARAFVSSPRLFVMDEPEASLDFSVRHKALSLIRERVEKNGTGALISLHDPSLALNFCDKILVLHNGTVLNTLFPKKDSLSSMEERLYPIYGRVSIVKCQRKDGGTSLVMLKEG